MFTDSEAAMQSKEFDINLAENLHLAADLKLGNKIYAKGYALTKEDILIFKMHDINSIFGVMMEDGDISYQTALGIISAKLCGANTAYALDEKGICQIISTVDGIFVNSEDRVAKFNRLNPHVVLNTIEPYGVVKEGEVIARLEVTLPALPQDEVDEIIFKLSGNSELLSVAPQKAQNICLLYAKQQDISAETKHFTAVVKRLVKEFKGLQFNFAHEVNAEYNVESVADGIQNALRFDNDIIFILGAAQTGSMSDVIPSALGKVVDNIVSVRMPQVGATDLVIAEKNNQKIIVMPYDYDKADTLIINRLIKQAAFSDKINQIDFERHQIPQIASGQPLPEYCRSSLVSSANHSGDVSLANIGAVVLAAGVGSRSGRDKLLAEVEDGVPLFLKAVNAAISSNASPVFVITGYRHEELEEYLENVDVNIIYNPAYRSGIKTSIALGLKSIPSFCEGALILPADMPNITAEDINKLIKSFKRGEEKQLCMFTHHGIKSNPVIWSSALFERADIVPEESQLRPIFIEHSDYTNYVEIADDGKFLDVTFPADIEQLQKALNKE